MDRRTADRPRMNQEHPRNRAGFITGRTDCILKSSEQIDPEASYSRVRVAPGLGQKPVVILSHSSKFRLDPSLPEEVSLKLFSRQRRCRVRWDH